MNQPGLTARSANFGISTVMEPPVPPVVFRKTTRCIMLVECVVAVGGMMVAPVMGALCLKVIVILPPHLLRRVWRGAEGGSAVRLIGFQRHLQMRRAKELQRPADSVAHARRHHRNRNRDPPWCSGGDGRDLGALDEGVGQLEQLGAVLLAGGGEAALLAAVDAVACVWVNWLGLVWVGLVGWLGCIWLVAFAALGAIETQQQRNKPTVKQRGRHAPCSLPATQMSPEGSSIATEW
jgi:hypothetical protein